MKRNDKKLTTLILAGAMSLSAVLGTAFLGGVSASADDETTAKTYALSSLFTTSNATVDADAIGDETEMTTKFVFDKTAKTSSVTFKRNVAFKWFAAKGDARYMSTTFAFGKLDDFKSADVTLNSSSSLTEEKAKNVVKFEMTDAGVSVYVVSDGATDEEIAAAKANAAILSVTDGTEITLSFTEDKPADADETFAYAYDEYGVKIKVGDTETIIGKFTHLGSSYASTALVFEAVAADEGEDPVVYFDEINNQKFNNIKTEGEDDAAKLVVADTAAPVVVANEKLNAFYLGAKYAFDYTVVDVLQTSGLSDVNKYYQFNPADTETSYKSLGTTTYFMDEVYYVTESGAYTLEKETDGKANVACSVFRDYVVNGVKGGNEYVSVQITVGDDTYKNDDGDYAKVVYDLSWYAEDGATQALSVGETTLDFLKVNTSQTGAVYSYIGIDDENKVNVVTAENKAILDAHVEAYNNALQAAADKVYAGSNAKLELPSLSWLFEDDNGYSSLKFSIAYRTASSTGLTKTNVAYNNLTIPTTSVGGYEFKILATDKSGNAMQYYLDGELVDVTTSNIWDIEEIPYFAFKVTNRGLRVEESSGTDDEDRTTKQTIDKTYSLSSFTVVGGSNQEASYALYKVDMNKYNEEVAKGSNDRLSRKILASVTFENIRTNMLDKLYLVNDSESEYYDDYFELYKDTYLELIAKEIGGNVADLEKYVVKIEAYDAENEDAADNKYEWQKSGTSSFKTAEEGEYVIFADYCDTLLPTVSRAVAYKLVVVESEVDSIKGETEWLKNNVVSVVLFSLAGVMFVLVIVLLLIKPSDESLENVGKQEKTKAKTKK